MIRERSSTEPAAGNPPVPVEGALRAVPFFGPLSDAEVRALIEVGQTLAVEARRVVFREGDEADRLYVVLAGRVRVYKRGDDGQEMDLANLEEGGYFGELALLDGGARSACVSTVTPCRLFALDRASFLETLTRSPDLLSHLFTALTSRIRETTQRSFREELAARTLKTEMELEKHRALSQMVAGVAHELNTPLGIVNTAASVIKKQLTPETSEEPKAASDELLAAVGLIERNIARAYKLTEDFKKVSVSQLSDVKERIDLSQAIDEVVGLFRINARRAGLEVEVQHTLGPESRAWLGYRGYLSQVILNLLTNVERYAYPDRRGGKVLVRVAEEADGREPYFVVTVQDFGRGIPPEDLPRVFDAFFTTGRGKGGSGLGLAIVHNIVNSALKGSVAAESELDKGTRVTVRFPKTIVD